jgi:predicted RNase H-like HicB family nuclease
MAWTQFFVAVREKEGEIVVSVPDLPGCECRAETKNEALGLIHHHIAAHISELHVRGKSIPSSLPPLVHRQKPELTHAVWHILEVWL